MMDFSTFQAAGGLPVYQQIVTFIKRNLAAGTIRDGDELPSRRALSALLGINPNTAQKIYRLLETEGLISSRSGAKSHVTADRAVIERIRVELLEQDAKGVVDAMRRMGLTKAQAVALIEKYWTEEV